MTILSLNDVLEHGTLEIWKQVPRDVPGLYKRAKTIQDSLLPFFSHYPSLGVFWAPKDNTLWLELSDKQAVSKLPELITFAKEAGHPTYDDVSPPETYDFLPVKYANETWVNKPFRWAGEAMPGGPSPLTHSVVGGLMGGALGYGGGWLASKLLPREYFDRKRLPKTLGIAGAALGAAPGLINAYQNANISHDAGKPLGLSALWTPDSQVPIGPNESVMRYNRQLGQAQKQSMDYNFTTGGSQLPPVPVDAFNRAIWNDVGRGLESSRYNPYGTKDVWGNNYQDLRTPPEVGALVSGIVNGVDAQAGGPGLLSPQHFISGLIGAGVDNLTARVIGIPLAALGGLTPPAQQKLQDMGIWGGFMRGVAGSLLGRN